MTAAAFTACYSDWKLVKTRGVVQVIFEVPLEQADLAYKVVGGMPNGAEEAWFAIAKLNLHDAPVIPDVGKKRLSAPADSAAKLADGHGGQSRATSIPAPVADTQGRAPKSWHTMTPAQQAGILCADKSFQTFLKCSNENEAAEWVRNSLGVTSRSLIPNGNPEWRSIISDYRAWLREPEVVG